MEVGVLSVWQNRFDGTPCLSYGAMDFDVVEASMDLFSREVLPELQKLCEETAVA